MSSSIVFCIQICLIQYVFSQRANGPAIVNNGLAYGPNTALNGQVGPALGGPIPGPGMGPLGPNQGLGPYGQVMPNPPAYGGAGTGDVAVTGEVPVAGMTAITGQVPLTGKVAFNGNVPCGGIVTITGTCTCGANAPYGQVPNYGNKPYGY